MLNACTGTFCGSGVQTMVTPSMVRFNCVPSHVLFAIVGGASTKAIIGAFCGLPGAIMKFDIVSVYVLPGVIGIEVGTATSGGTICDTAVAGAPARFVTTTACGAEFTRTSSSFTVPGSGSLKGNTELGKYTGLKVVGTFTVIGILHLLLIESPKR